MDRALDYESRCQEFESSRAHYHGQILALIQSSNYSTEVFKRLMLIFVKIFKVTIIGIAILLATVLQAHEITRPYKSSDWTLAKNLSNQVKFTELENTVSIKSNGIPNHKTGIFPTRGNPHKIREQTHSLYFTKYPQKSDYITPSKFFGIALNGVMFVPQTAECWSPEKQQAYLKTNKRPSFINRIEPQIRTKGPCDWREEAIILDKKRLGLDMNNAHVQPNGMYHYHGLPTGLIETQITPNNLIHVGFAGDGFKIFVSLKDEFKSSYRLKNGARNSGPDGVHDGTYTQDFEFLNGIGDLDECNGMDTNAHGYIYLITKEFPFIPRCWKGYPHPSFKSRP